MPPGYRSVEAKLALHRLSDVAQQFVGALIVATRTAAVLRVRGTVALAADRIEGE